MASPTLLLPPLLLMLLLLLLTSAASDGFRVGFERWPSSEVVAVPGTEVRLPCSTNDTADKISWKFNSHFLHSPGSGPEYTVPEGFQVVAVQGGSELVVRLSESEAQYADQTGLYQCVAWFGPIALTSLPGKLQAAVLRAPEGEVQQEEVQVVEGGAVRVECEVPYSIPDATLTFYRDGTLLDLTNEAYQQTPHGDLLVMGVGVWAEGVYTCYAHNQALGRGVTLPTATRVKVLPRAPALPVAPPVFVTLGTVYSGHAGTNLTLPCLANGNPKPVVRWSRYGTALPSGASEGIDGSLQLPSVAVEDAGTYLCHASNGVGKEKILHVSVEVVEPPSITRAPQSQRVEEGEALTLHCRARGHPQPRVMWVFNGEVVFDYGNIAVTDEGLVIRAVQKEHAGIFQCFAHNPEGAVQGVAMVSVVPRTVTAVPGATHTRPDHVPDDVGPRRKNVQDGDSTGGSGGRGGRKGRKGPKRKKTEREGDLSSHGGSKMRKGGKGNRKKGRMVPPSIPHITKVSDESVMVSWEGPPESQSLPILFYKVQYKLVRIREHQGSQWRTADENIIPRTTSYEVTGLQTGRVYRFRIAAVYTNNDNLLGPTSRRFLLEEDSNTQRPEVPPTITSLHQEAPTLVRARWSYNSTPGIPVEGFFIYYRESTVAGSYIKLTVLDPDKREHVVSHLKANVSYDFKMQCFNMAGRSNFSKVMRNNAPGHSVSTTQEPQEGEVEAREQVPVVREGEPSSVSSTHLYIILGAALGLLLLIVVVSASVYTCRNKNSDDDTRSVKYEDTSLHIHRETSTYSLPQTPRGKGPNGYLPHQGITITADDEKAVMESSVTENNNHSTRQVSRCFTSPARRIASEDGCVDMGVKTLAITKTTYDTGPPPSPPLSAVESPGKEYAYHS
ncbi:interference hedgehog-like isoform X2 [Portunus trituberculatus]|uniref:interference hedgehog-like isoform X2 n=1 Tax=Portunus trituberculatus TaxID=210409 RepID=UPI001E1D215F|nr:interference hedgehog-like isoform X2 [Portunus trituberculatus]